MINFLEIAISKVGGLSKRVSSLSTLLSAWELPGNGWIVMSERTWSVGSFEHHIEGEIWDRAKKQGGFIAWRSFTKAKTQTGIWEQVIPYASEQDAVSAIPRDFSGFAKNSRFIGSSSQAKSIDGLVLQGVEHARFFEKMIKTETGEESITRIVCGNVGPIGFTLACSNMANDLDWDDVLFIATLFSQKIAKTKGIRRL